MLVSKRREPKGAILFCILLIPDSYIRHLEELDHRGQNFPFWHAAPVQVSADDPANPRQRLPEGLHPVKLHQVTCGPVCRMVSILLPALRVPADSLNMAIG